MFSSDKNYWETPQWLYDELDKEFHFTLDAAASDDNHKCDRYYTADDDGLTKDWTGETVFVNPLMEIRKQGIGPASAMKKLKSQIQR